MVKTHVLKTIEPYFSAVKNGDKTFEIRKFDRDFEVGDELQLVQYDPSTNKFGSSVSRRITYMLTDKPYVPDGYVVLGMKEFDANG